MPTPSRSFVLALPVIVRALGRVCRVGATLALLGPTPAACAQSPSLTSAWLLDRDQADRALVVEQSRPVPLDVAQRAAAVAALPDVGEVLVFDASEALRLAGVPAVLRTARREGVFVVKVLDLPQAVVALFERSAVLISRPVLQLLSVPELQALVAHELGHEFVRAEWSEARRAGDRQRLHEVELVCDIIAMVIVESLGQDPRALLHGLQKLTNFNVERFARSSRDQEYPTLAVRRSVVQRFVRPRK